MVHVTPFIGAFALLSGFVSALPSSRRADDSSVGEEVAVSAPNGIPLTDSVELASQSAREAASSTIISLATPTVTKYGSGYGSGNAGYGGYGTQKENSGASSSSSSSWAQATSTSSAYSSYSTPYGSGNSNWGNSDYNDCVQQCVASYGSLSSSYKPTATNAGATHTVIVAPTQGVLRYIPFAVNASVGDTVKFVWGANNHTVTKSSALLPCNKSGDALFASGTQNKGFTFTQVVNDTKPTYFYCATPGHCTKGMFGIINPTTNFASPSSVSLQMQSIGTNNSDVSAYAAYTFKQTLNNAAASKWGGNIDIAALPEWAHSSIAENVLYTRNFLASNPEALNEDGAVDLSTGDATPFIYPQDIAAVLNNAATASSAASTIAAPIATPSSDSAATTPGTTESLSNSASSIASPRLLVGAAAILATILL